MSNLWLAYSTLHEQRWVIITNYELRSLLLAFGECYELFGHWSFTKKQRTNDLILAFAG
ncbi:MAG: hypothetical protein ACYTXA_03225 [Nostoc sp.]